MGASLSSACSTVEKEEQLSQPEVGEDLEVFDRTTLAQVKSGNVNDNYELLEELGSGSFGVVNRARDIRTKCVSMAAFVAVKTIPKKKISDPKKIKDEFNTIRQLDHAHICKAYECYEDRRSIYLVMDICTGGTLLETLCKQQKFTESDAANIMRQILCALAYLHQSKFIFRDLKTENIMFAKPVQQGAIGNVKLIDFGLCCPFERGTKIARAAGTPYSVAPELVTAPVQYDQKCDAWSAGVVMYIILSGQYPFKGKTKEELLNRIRKEPVSFKDKRWKKISKDGKTLLAELLRKNAETRCEVLTALEYPWLQVGNNLPDHDIMQDVVDTMVRFQNLNMLQKAAMTALAWRASDEDTQHLRQIFESIDRDGNGHMTVPELKSAFEESGVTVPDELSLFNVGTDGNDTIEYTEFLAAALDKQKILKEDVVWEAFKIFDQDGSGSVTKKELCKILTGRTSDKIRKVHGDNAIETFLDTYDTTGDGIIDFDEFMGMLGSDSTKKRETQGGARKTKATVTFSEGGVNNVLSKCTELAICSACRTAAAGTERSGGAVSERGRQSARKSTKKKSTSARSPSQRK